MSKVLEVHILAHHPDCAMQARQWYLDNPSVRSPHWHEPMVKVKLNSCSADQEALGHGENSAMLSIVQVFCMLVHDGILPCLHWLVQKDLQKCLQQI